MTELLNNGNEKKTLCRHPQKKLLQCEYGTLDIVAPSTQPEKKFGFLATILLFPP